MNNSNLKAFHPHIMTKLPQLNLYLELNKFDESFLEFFANLFQYVHQLPIDPKLKEVAIIRQATNANAKYHKTNHVHLAINLGVSYSLLDEILKKDKVVTSNPKINAICAIVDELEHKHTISGTTILDIKNHLDQKEIKYFTILISFYSFLSKITNVFNIQSETINMV